MADYHPGLIATARYALEGLPQAKRAEFMVGMLCEIAGPAAPRILMATIQRLESELRDRIDSEIEPADPDRHHVANIARHGGQQDAIPPVDGGQK